MIQVNEFILCVMDAILGWMLAWPRDATLIALSVLTAGILVVVRRFTTDQERLGRCEQDKKRLKILVRLARRAGDKEAVSRYRSTLGAIALIKARSEVMPLLVSLVPVAVLATWACQRVAYVPVPADRDVVVTMYLPVSAEGQVMHMVPVEGVECSSGWVQQAKIAQTGARGYCVARWTVRGRGCDRPYDLAMRYGGSTYHNILRVGQTVYDPPVQACSDGKVLAIETQLQESKLFGVIGGIRWIGMPAWLTGYFLVSVPAMMLIKRGLRVR